MSMSTTALVPPRGGRAHSRAGFDPADISALGWPGRVFAPGEWGSIVNGGAWLTVGGGPGGSHLPGPGRGAAVDRGGRGGAVRDPPGGRLRGRDRDLRP